MNISEIFYIECSKLLKIKAQKTKRKSNKYKKGNNKKKKKITNSDRGDH